MNFSPSQIWELRHLGHAHYWTSWLTAPLRGDRVFVADFACRVVAVVHDDHVKESRVIVERVG